MPAQESISAVILDRETRGEASLYMTAFSPECGLLPLFKRMSTKKTSLAPDLFEEISAQIRAPDAANSPVRFLQQYEVLKSRAEISHSYEKLCAACEIAAIVKLNGANISETRSLFALLGAALDGISTSANTSAVKIKFAYVMAKEQGYAVREDFFRSLSQTDRADFATILKTPAAELDSLRDPSVRLYQHLANWLRNNTDILLA